MDRNNMPDAAFALPQNKLFLHHTDKVKDGNEHDTVDIFALEACIQSLDLFWDDSVKTNILAHLMAHKNELNNKVECATWTTEFINDLPDSSFAVIEKGGKKVDGKTEPRSYRHLPYKDADGKIDLPHLRNALARMNQINAVSPKDTTSRIRAVAKRVLIAAAKKSLPDSKFAQGEILGAKAKLIGIEKEGQVDQVDLQIEMPNMPPIDFPLDIYYDKEGKVVEVKLYWQTIPGLILQDVSDFLSILSKDAIKPDISTPNEK